MGRRRFYAPPEAFNASSRTATLEADEARHLREVLRLKPGDEVFVFDGAGSEFRCTVESSRRESAVLNVLEEVDPPHPESALELTLAVALLKSDKFDLVVQKATELGVSRVVPVMTKLADIKLKDESDANKRVTRWRRIAMEAAKQSGRALIPEIMTSLTFHDLILGTALLDLTESRGQLDTMLFAERGGVSFDTVHIERKAAILALVGSEGGWTNDELDAAKTAGWKLITLGGRTLRAETAAIAVATLLQHRFGDLN
jgi:16S rRNA (uracil1498-N3)-methyltransferase